MCNDLFQSTPGFTNWRHFLDEVVIVGTAANHAVILELASIPILFAMASAMPFRRFDKSSTGSTMFTYIAAIAARCVHDGDLSGFPEPRVKTLFIGAVVSIVGRRQRRTAVRI